MLTNGRLIAAGESHVMLSFEWKSSTLDMDWPSRFVGVIVEKLTALCV